MSVSTMFTPREMLTPRLRTGTQVAGVTVTVRETEAHTYTANVSKLALESGAIVSDHMILEPETVTVSFRMTNSGDGRQAAKDAFAAFVQMQQERQLVELVTEHAIYPNMALISLTPNHAAPFRGSFTATATFQRVYFVELVSAGRAPTQLRGVAQKTAAGQTQAGRVEPVNYNSSALRTMWDGPASGGV